MFGDVGQRLNKSISDRNQLITTSHHRAQYPLTRNISLSFSLITCQCYGLPTFHGGGYDSSFGGGNHRDTLTL